ncbi:hypothetical protein LJC17_05020 [Acholeplasma sp. OttesenSCG-928-E16]|nr:hypothetical protein [Acholeplasma sp. OttesenSCG-928-E16]
MRKPVENSIIGRLIRTIGYIGFLLSMAIYLVFLVNELGIQQLESVINPLMDLIKQMKLEDLFIVTIVHFSSLLLLVWCLSKNLVLRIITSVLLVFMFGSVVSRGIIISYGVGLIISPEGLNNFLNPIFQVINGGFAGLSLIFEFVALFFVWMIFAYKRPKRVATSLIHFAYFIGAFAAVTVGLQVFVNLALNEIVLNICNYVFIGFQVLAIIGSVFGILGIFRK